MKKFDQVFSSLNESNVKIASLTFMKHSIKNNKTNKKIKIRYNAYKDDKTSSLIIYDNSDGSKRDFNDFFKGTEFEKQLRDNSDSMTDYFEDARVEISLRKTPKLFKTFQKLFDQLQREDEYGRARAEFSTYGVGTEYEPKSEYSTVDKKVRSILKKRFDKMYSKGSKDFPTESELRDKRYNKPKPKPINWGSDEDREAEIAWGKKQRKEMISNHLDKLRAKRKEEEDQQKIAKQKQQSSVDDAVKKGIKSGKVVDFRQYLNKKMGVSESIEDIELLVNNIDENAVTSLAESVDISFNECLEVLTIDEDIMFVDTYKELLEDSQCNCQYDDLQITESEYEGKKVKLNDPIRTSESKNHKFKVYVKNEKGNVVVVRFGDPDMEIKRDDPERRKSFRARHNCDDAGPKWKARYWSCYQWRSNSNVDN